MTAYTASYSIRYSIQSIQQQAEFAVVTAADQIKNEDAGAPNHADRLQWAQWVNNNNSVVATWPFLWPIAMNPSIQASVAADPTGATVTDNDVQFVVNSNLDGVIAAWIASQPL